MQFGNNIILFKRGYPIGAFDLPNCPSLKSFVNFRVDSETLKV